MEDKQTCEDLEELKTLLGNQLEKTNVRTIVRRVISDIGLSKGFTELESINPDDVLREIYARGFMENIMESLRKISLAGVDQQQKNKVNAENGSSSSSSSIPLEERWEPYIPLPERKPEESTQITHGKVDCTNYVVNHNLVGVESSKQPRKHKDGKYFMKLELLDGKGFLEHLYNYNGETLLENNSPGQRKSSKGPFLQIHVIYKSQRFSSKKVRCSSSDPPFKDLFMIELGWIENINISQLLKSNEPITFIATCTNGNGVGVGSLILLSHCIYDWRHVLRTPDCSKQCAIELKGIGPEHNVVIGLIDIRLTILPHLNEQLTLVTYSTQLAMEKSKQDEQERLYLVYTRQWWKDFIEIRPTHHRRLVKLFSYDENTISRPVQTFVQPIIADRQIRTPMEAAWFVALIPICDGEADDIVRNTSSATGQGSTSSGTLSNYWQSVEATLLSKCGRVEDHAILFRSLFAGFELSCYVAIGTKFGETPWIWVVILDCLDKEPNPIFWESTTGQCIEHITPPKGELLQERMERIKHNEIHKYKSIDCLFNNESFLANIQESTLIEKTDWNLSNPSKWKQIPKCTVQSLQKTYHPIHLMPPTQNPAILATELEIELKRLVSSSRANQDMSTKWDNTLSRILGQELARYEIAGTTGGSDFPSHLKNATMKHLEYCYEVKAIPIHFSCATNPNKIFYDSLRQGQIDGVIYRRGVDVQLAIRVDVFVYPEDITSVRVMFACKYRLENVQN